MSDHNRVTYRIKDLEISERPRERLEQLGAQSLSKAELLAILLRVGVAGENAVQLGQRLLETFGGISGLHQAPFKEMCNQYGLGPAKVAQIKAAIELGRRMTLEAPVEKNTIHSPEDVALLVRFEMSVLEQEELWVLALDTRNRVINIQKVYRGSLNSSHIRIGELFRQAIRVNAASIIVVHNHPSGDPNPSPDDLAVTKVILQSGKFLDIEVLDHIIIGAGSFVSLKERGLGFAD